MVDGRQHENLLEETRVLKRGYKYVCMEDLIRSTFLMQFMMKVGVVCPVWELTDIQKSLSLVVAWQSRVVPFARYVIHNVTANRQEMTKAVKNVIKGKVNGCGAECYFRSNLELLLTDSQCIFLSVGVLTSYGKGGKAKYFCFCLSHARLQRKAYHSFLLFPLSLLTMAGDLFLLNSWWCRKQQQL